MIKMKQQIIILLLLLIATATSGVKVLSLDAGSVRAYTEIASIQYLSQEIYDDPTGLTFINQFDIIVGTSAGSCIGAAMRSGRTIQQVREFFANFSTRTFPYPLVNHTTLFNTSDYHDVLKDGIGYKKGRDLSILKKFIAVTTDVRSDNWFTYLWTSYPNPGNNLTDSMGFVPNSRDYFLHEFALGSTAVPGFFNSVIKGDIEVVDGAVTYPNPTLIGILEARRLYPYEPVELVVSLGTGRSDIKLDLGDTPVEAILDLPFIAQEQHEKSMVYLEDQLPKTVYHRFNPHNEIGSVIALDEMNFTKLEWVEDVTRDYLMTNSRQAAIRRLKCSLRKRFRDCHF